MIGYKQFIILCGAIILGILFGSFFWWYQELGIGVSRAFRVYVWTLNLAVGFVILIRIWDAWRDDNSKSSRSSSDSNVTTHSESSQGKKYE
jgi:UDP-N-acetylmuramyl pentapeptide phosphotransferase/UDP-N-acetylglucosamine-1-phosphate transferase